MLQPVVTISHSSTCKGQQDILEFTFIQNTYLCFTIESLNPQALCDHQNREDKKHFLHLEIKTKLSTSLCFRFFWNTNA